ncbi:MAG: TM1812 family CRISPR-associated protein [Acidobacteriota bacterium]
MTGNSTQANANHILLTGLGERAKRVCYTLGGRQVTAELAPLALIQLLEPPDRPHRVFAMVTRGAREKTWTLFQDGVQQAINVAPEPIAIPDGRNDSEIRQIVEAVAAKVPEAIEVTIDVTQGLRHFPFLLYGISLYLQSLRGIRIRGAYYGMLEGSDEKDAKPIVNLQPLIEMPEWFHAVRVFKEAGSTHPIVRLVQPLAEHLRQHAIAKGNDPSLHQQATEVAQFAERLERIGDAVAAGLPLELGKASTLLAGQRIPGPLVNSLPLGNEIFQQLSLANAPFCFLSPPTWSGEWKRKVPLNQAELDRQAVLIERLFESNHLPAAIGLLEEWIVSWVILHELKEDQRVRWLDFKEVRRKASQRLGVLAAHATEASGGHQQWSRFWSQLTELRNTVHHHGMREQSWESAPESLKPVLEFWGCLRRGEILLSAFGGGGGTLLITPQGSRPGVFYSALKATEPNRCLVVCSLQTQATVEEAASKAGSAGPVKKLLLQDPFSGFDELPALSKEARSWLLEADEVVANLTGGTTLMGIAVQQLLELGQKLGRPGRRFALIDRRPPTEQDAQPYVASEFRWLDDETEGERDAYD